ncbi:ERCC4 domain-containing protein [Mycena indigotica]|uniref:ERCC4 domain-containing protein n=1 Tax=Mycena indigotica TaxID=2126181 RepID=A0A8H6W0J7_9AGAR|nr:ERCC4 domain-containing protein [Mycena indigotica]KAF7301049.1 ERCC4 domain-containing protein [Mycena indigotica]
MSTLLPFHKTILERIHDPTNNDLLVLARGLGLRRIICTLLKIYDTPGSTVLLVNATPEEELEIGEELGIMGCRNPGLRVIGYETQNKDRQALYLSGGLFSVTSRILVVDMLQGDLPTAKVTGMLVLHAERVTPLALEAFIIRLYREKNKTGFLKGFTDQAEHISSGISPLKNIMKELQLRNVHIYPRFQEDIKKSLERRRADVVELSQHMTETMAGIHHAIIECMNSTLAELKRSYSTLDLDELTVENAYFRSFDVIVRRQLDSVWHKTGPKTKQLVSDLGVLRRLLTYLLTYDPLQFHAYLETLLATGSVTVMGVKENRSPWMISDVAHLIFDGARRRCYLGNFKPKPPPAQNDDDDGWAALDELDGIEVQAKADVRPQWLPYGLEPVLEELPKWGLLAEALQEIEGDILRIETADMTRKGPPLPGSNVVLIMTSSTRTCRVISEFLSTKDDSLPRGAQGRAMLMKRLRVYLWWKTTLARRKADGKPGFGMPDIIPGESGFKQGYPTEERGVGTQISEALKKKDREMADRNARRRRVRGGAPTPSATTRDLPGDSADAAIGTMNTEADDIAAFWQNHGESVEQPEVNIELLQFDVTELEQEFDTHYGLLAPQQTVVVRAYGGDADDRMLAELQPRFIVMYEPNMDFVRRIEVYRSSSPGLNVRVYHMIYGNSSEEHRYLAGVRKEKDAFQRLIKERGTMLLPIFEDKADARSDALIKTISTRIAGGRREVRAEPAQVIVDMREFRSSLPSLLHAASMLVIPATLTVGDYILTPDICVERKSIPDLVSSFNSGRLYTQCELMSVHYKHPVLLIEFEEDKAFSLEVVSDMKSYAKPTGKYPPKAGGSKDKDNAQPLLQSKLVLLLLSFPRLRIIWASSPHSSAEIFADLKANNAEPSPHEAIAIGAEADPDVGAGVNAAAEELLRALPGVTAKNVAYVASKIQSVRALCDMTLVEVQGILGVEPGKACFDFLHKGDQKR